MQSVGVSGNRAGQQFSWHVGQDTYERVVNNMTCLHEKLIGLCAVDKNAPLSSVVFTGFDRILTGAWHEVVLCTWHRF